MWRRSVLFCVIVGCFDLALPCFCLSFIEATCSVVWRLYILCYDGFGLTLSVCLWSLLLMFVFKCSYKSVEVCTCCVQAFYCFVIWYTTRCVLFCIVLFCFCSDLFLFVLWLYYLRRLCSCIEARWHLYSILALCLSSIIVFWAFVYLVIGLSLTYSCYYGLSGPLWLLMWFWNYWGSWYMCCCLDFVLCVSICTLLFCDDSYLLFAVLICIDIILFCYYFVWNCHDLLLICYDLLLHCTDVPCVVMCCLFDIIVRYCVLCSILFSVLLDLLSRFVQIFRLFFFVIFVCLLLETFVLSWNRI